MKELDKAFKETCTSMLGSELCDLLDLESWLTQRVPVPFPVKSALSNKETWTAPKNMYMNIGFEEKRTISYSEIDKLKTNFTVDDLSEVNSIKDMKKILDPVLYYFGDFRYGTYKNLEKTSTGGKAENVYCCEEAYFGVKNVAYCNWIIGSEYLFAAHNAPYCSFGIQIYNSTKIKNCFEMDGCTSCRDCFFCHNSEGLNNCIFCFNAKNLKYAVGNTEVGKEKYQEIKKILTDYIVGKLKKEKSLGINIHNIGCSNLFSSLL